MPRLTSILNALANNRSQQQSFFIIIIIFGADDETDEVFTYEKKN